MPGPYAHITLLYELLNPVRRWVSFEPASGLEHALADHFAYCLLGSVSPDYPNLVSAPSSMPQWADAMHGLRTAALMKSGIRLLAQAAPGEARNRQMAWFLGFCSHMAADMTIHPAVRAKVGDYAANQRRHRICEMHQDSHIYRRMNMGEIGESECFALIASDCSAAADLKLDENIKALWQVMLVSSYPELASREIPDPSLWHRSFVERIVRSRTKQRRYFPLADLISEKISEEYPLCPAIDRQYLEELEIPASPPLHLHYDEIFDHAATNVVKIWKQIEQALLESNPDKLEFSDWDLDTGLDQNGRLVFWQH